MGFESLRARSYSRGAATGLSGCPVSRGGGVPTTVPTALGWCSFLAPESATSGARLCARLLPWVMGTPRGDGSVRQRRTGVWEVRVALGPDPVSGRSRVRSITVRGDESAAAIARSRWAAEATLVRARGHARPAVTLAELLDEWLDADHRWRPSTLAGYRSTAGFLIRDPLSARRAVGVTPRVLRAATSAWSAAGWREPTVSGRVRCLRAALGWA